MPIIEYVGKFKQGIEMHGVGTLKKGKSMPCSTEIAAEFAGDKRFKVTDLYTVKNGAIPKIKGGSK